MRVGIDIDDVIFAWHAKAHAACVKAGVTNGKDAVSWEMHKDYGITLQEWLDVLEAATKDGSLYHGAPMLGTVTALQRLKDEGHSVHLVTARGFFSWGTLIRSLTVQWLADNEIPHDSLTFTKDKSLLRIDVLADDALHNVTAATEAGIATCHIGAKHNVGSEHWWQARNIVEFVDDICAGQILELA